MPRSYKEADHLEVYSVTTSGLQFGTITFSDYYTAYESNFVLRFRRNMQFPSSRLLNYVQVDADAKPQILEYEQHQTSYTNDVDCTHSNSFIILNTA